MNCESKNKTISNEIFVHSSRETSNCEAKVVSASLPSSLVVAVRNQNISQYPLSRHCRLSYVISRCAVRCSVISAIHIIFSTLPFVDVNAGRRSTLFRGFFLLVLLECSFDGIITNCCRFHIRMY